MRQFYLIIVKGATLWHQLSWSHYRELLPISNINEINYYISEIEKNNNRTMPENLSTPEKSLKELEKEKKRFK